MQTLEQQVNEKMRILSELEAQGGEITEEQESQIMELDTTLPEKIDSYVFRIRQLDNQSEFLKKQAKELTQAAKSLDNEIEQMELRVKQAMQTLSTNEIKGRKYRFSLSKTKPALVVDESKISKDYLKIVETITINKELISSDLQKGIPVEGAELQERFALKQFVMKETN